MKGIQSFINILNIYSIVCDPTTTKTLKGVDAMAAEVSIFKVPSKSMLTALVVSLSVYVFWVMMQTALFDWATARFVANESPMQQEFSVLRLGNVISCGCLQSTISRLKLGDSEV